jgi:hypothetical protein
VTLEAPFSRWPVRRRRYVGSSAAVAAGLELHTEGLGAGVLQLDAQRAVGVAGPYVEAGRDTVRRAGQFDPEAVRALDSEFVRTTDRYLFDELARDVDMCRRGQLTAVRVDREVRRCVRIVAQS